MLAKVGKWCYHELKWGDWWRNMDGRRQDVKHSGLNIRLNIKMEMWEESSWLTQGDVEPGDVVQGSIRV